MLTLSIPLDGDGVIPHDERDRLWKDLATLVPLQLLEEVRRNVRNKLHDALDKLYATRRRLIKIAELRKATPGNYLPAVLPKGNLILPSCLNNTDAGKAFLDEVKKNEIDFAFRHTNTLMQMLTQAERIYAEQATFPLIWERALHTVDKDLAPFRCCANTPPPTPAQFPEDFFPAGDPRHNRVRSHYAPALIGLAMLLRCEARERDTAAEHRLLAELESDRKRREERQALDIAAQQDKARSVTEISVQAANAAAQEASRPLESRVHKMENELHQIASSLEKLAANFATLSSGAISDRADRVAPAAAPTRTPPAAAARAPASPRGATGHSLARAQQRSPARGQRAPQVAAVPNDRLPNAPHGRNAPPTGAQGHRLAPPNRSDNVGNRPRSPPGGPSPVTTRGQRARNGRPLHTPAPNSPEHSDADDFWESPSRRRRVHYDDPASGDDFFTPRRDNQRRDSPRRAGNAFAALANHAPRDTASERAHDEASRANTSDTQRLRNSQTSPRRSSRGGSARGASRR